MVHTVWKKRAFAAVMSVAMLGTSMAATPIVWAAGTTTEIQVGQELAISSSESESYTDGGGNKQTRPIKKFSYWFGINVTSAYGDWYSPAEEAIEGYIDYGTSESSDFTITIDLSKVEVNYYQLENWAVGQWWNEEKRFDMQNCYAETVSGKEVPVTLKSVTVNGTAKDMMVSTDPNSC